MTWCFSILNLSLCPDLSRSASFYTSKEPKPRGSTKPMFFLEPTGNLFLHYNWICVWCSGKTKDCLQCGCRHGLWNWRKAKASLMQCLGKGFLGDKEAILGAKEASELLMWSSFQQRGNNAPGFFFSLLSSSSSSATSLLFSSFSFLFHIFFLFCFLLLSSKLCTFLTDIKTTAYPVMFWYMHTCVIFKSG